MEKIAQRVLEKKPDLAKNTIKTYVSLLSSVWTAKNGAEPFEWDWYEKSVPEVIEFVLAMNKPNTSKKTIMIALLAVTGDERYKEEILKLNVPIREEELKQEKTEKQSENWIEYPEVKKVVDEYAAKALPLLKKGNPLSADERMTVQNYIILCLTTGIYIPPRRSEDWVSMKTLTVRGKQVPEFNFIRNKQFNFVSYKTAKKYGEQIVPIPPALFKIIQQWKKINNSDWLLSREDGSKMENYTLTKILNSIFGKKVSTSMLRHIFLSSELGDVPELQKLNDLATKMSHSINTQLSYIKR
jgi:integrase